MAEPDIETTLRLQPRFDAAGLIAAVAQDAETGEVLMLAWMNAEALRLTLETGQATYWSRSRGTLWRKGEESGHTQAVVEVRVDCDQDAVLLRVRQTGAACHTGARSCFYRAASFDGTLTRVG
ncbi:MAG: phosphoribosyl-AMP cyclohydrolase [Hyphomonadaceae bacterium]|nr:phosphoribosyl-AMP cyclohydrolase [Hyphomonadaceae bacterium]